MQHAPLAGTGRDTHMPNRAFAPCLAGRSFPEDAQLVQRIVRFLDSQPGGGAQLPSGTRLTPRAFQLLGLSGLGSSGAWQRPQPAPDADKRLRPRVRSFCRSRCMPPSTLPRGAPCTASACGQAAPAPPSPPQAALSGCTTYSRASSSPTAACPPALSAALRAPCRGRPTRCTLCWCGRRAPQGRGGTARHSQLPLRAHACDPAH